MIELRALGSLELTIPGQGDAQSLLTRPKPLGLLIYLALHSSDGYHRRDSLMALFWPDYPEQQARHALSQALHVLREGLGDGVILKRGQEELRLDRTRLWCDAIAFQEAVERQDHKAALELYRGDLLEGFFVSEAAGFERWLGSERIRLQELAAGAAWRLARRRIDEGELVEAERTAQRALALVPTDESEVRRFIDALASAGDRAAAIRFYEKFAERLREEYELEPAPETQHLVELVRNRKAEVGESEEAALRANHVSATEADEATDSRSAKREEGAAPGRSSRLVVRAAAAAVVVVFAVTVAVISTSRGPADDPVFVPNRVVVALFENQTGDSSLAPLALMAADWITDGIVRSGMVEAITPTAVRQAFAAAESQGTSWTWSRGVVALAESMHAGTAITGSLYLVAGKVMIRAEVVRMPGMSAIGAVDPIEVTPTEPGSALATLCQRVMGLLAIHLDPRLSSWATTQQRPPTYEAYTEFVAGMGLMAAPGQTSGRPGGEERIEYMLRSAAIDTTFMAPLIEVLRTLASMQVGALPDLRDSVFQLLEQRHHLLTPVERYEFDAYRAMWDGNRVRVYQAMRRAADLAPDRVMRLAHAAFHIGRYRETIEIMEQPDLPVGIERYSWNALTKSLHLLGEHERELEAARRARLENRGHRGLMELEIEALAALGRIDEMESTMQESLNSGRTAEGEAPMGWGTAGIELLWHGHRAQGRAVIERVVDYVRAQPPEAQDPGGLAGAFMWLGRFDEARLLYEEVAQEREAGTFWGDIFMGGVGQAAAGQGDVDTALEICARLASGQYEPAQQAWIAMERAQIFGILGDCAAAVDLIEEALRLGVGHPFIHRRFGFMNCRDYPPFQELEKPRG